jgi:hypothetical protein
LVTGQGTYLGAHGQAAAEEVIAAGFPKYGISCTWNKPPLNFKYYGCMGGNIHVGSSLPAMIPAPLSRGVQMIKLEGDEPE